MAISFQKCNASDLDLLVKLSKTTFITAFEKDNNPEDFKAYITSAFREDVIKQQLNNSDSSFYFIYYKDALAGYFKLNENEAQNEQFDAKSMELERLYISEKFQGKNIGSQALQKTIEIAKNKNLDFLWLGVWEHNLAAIRFYKRHGFMKFGTHPYFLGNDKQTDWLMRYDFS